MNNRGNRYNGSGYRDMTAYKAIQRVDKEMCIKEIKAIANRYGFCVTYLRLKEWEDEQNDRG